MKKCAEKSDPILKMESEILKLKEDINNLNTRRTETANEFQNQSENKDMYNDELYELKKRREATKIHLAKVKNESLPEENENHSALICKLETDLQMQEEVINKLETKLKDIDSKLKNLSETQKKIDAELGELAEKFKTMSERIDALLCFRRDIEKLCNESYSNIDRTQIDSQEQIDESKRKPGNNSQEVAQDLASSDNVQQTLTTTMGGEVLLQTIFF